MITKIIFTIVGVFALFHLFKKRSLFARIVLGAQLASSIMFVIDPSKGLGAITITSLLVAAYGLFEAGLNSFSRLVVGASSSLLFISLLFVLEHWPYAGSLGLFLLLPLFGFTALLYRTGHKKLQPEVVVMVFVAVVSLLEFMTRIAWLSS